MELTGLYLKNNIRKVYKLKLEKEIHYSINRSFYSTTIKLVLQIGDYETSDFSEILNLLGFTRNDAYYYFKALFIFNPVDNELCFYEDPFKVKELEKIIEQIYDSLQAKLYAKYQPPKSKDNKRKTYDNKYYENCKVDKVKELINKHKKV